MRRYIYAIGQIVSFIIWAVNIQGVVEQGKDATAMWISFALLWVFTILFRFNEERIENERINKR